MGSKYMIEAKRNGKCPSTKLKQSRYFIGALWWFIRLSIKYPIVDLQLRRGYVPCQECSERAYCPTSNVRLT